MLTLKSCIRYTQSSHPRSGIVGCISFVVVSLGAKEANGLPSVVQVAWTRGLAFVVGVVAAVSVNWILWPFIARHELRKALSAMLIYSSIIYRGVVAKYVYYEDGEEPGEKDIERSGSQPNFRRNSWLTNQFRNARRSSAGRLRKNTTIASKNSYFDPPDYVLNANNQALTRHEVRLRGPFNPLPYSTLIDGCERFFEYLVAVRQSSLFFHPHFVSDNEQAAESLLAFRRDAVAAILMNLYVLAGALRGDRKVPVRRVLFSCSNLSLSSFIAVCRSVYPLLLRREQVKLLLTLLVQRYLPSAAAARKRLLDHMAELEAAQYQHQRPDSPLSSSDERNEKEGRKWAQIYSYSYSQNLTGCVKQLEMLQRYTKEIVGEQG